MVHDGLPVMNGRQLIRSGSLSPIAADGPTMIAHLDQVVPLSAERPRSSCRGRRPGSWSLRHLLRSGAASSG
jgi:hypothetical protein